MSLRTLTIQLNDATARRGELPASVERDYLGGRGAIAWLLDTQLPPDTAPLSPENMLVFAAGPLAGTRAFASSGFVVGTRSPLTGGIAYGWAQGHWGGALRQAGHDVLVLEGAADDWCWIQIDGPKTNVRPAGRLVGLDTVRTAQAIGEALGPDYSVVCIGPAGERNVAYSSIVAEGRYMAEPAGTGAVMADKRVKAIAVRGGKPLSVPDEQRMAAALDVIARRAETSLLADALRQQGSSHYLRRAGAIGALSAHNGQSGALSEALAHTSTAFALRGQQVSRGCKGCPMPCYSDYARVGRQVPRPELELVAGFGARCGVSDPDALIAIADTCLRLGLDPASAAAAVAFLMECQQRELHRAGNLPWGSSEAVIAALERLAQRHERRDVLSLGVAEMQEIFYGSAEFAPQVKGAAMPGLDPRAMQELALATATAPIGGDFRYAMSYAELVEEPPAWAPELAVHPQTTSGKAMRLIWHERFAAALDSAGLCRRLALLGYQVTPAELIALLGAATGRALGGAELARIGERIVTIERRFLLRYGYAATPDALPPRWADEPLAQGPAAGALPVLNELLPVYYRRHGWNDAGEPTAERLAELGIEM